MRNAFTTLRTSLAFYLLALLFPLSLFYTNNISSQVKQDWEQVHELKTIQNLLHLLTHKQPSGLSAAMAQQVDETFARIDTKHIDALSVLTPELRERYTALTQCWQTYKSDPSKPPHACWQHANKAHTAAAAAMENEYDRKLESLFLLLLASMIVTIAAIYIIRNQMKIQIDRHSMFDRVTGLFNRNYFQSEVKKVVSLSTRHAHALSMLYISLNNYEKITSGMLSDSGDKILHQFGTLIKSVIRESDIACRYDDNGFTVITPETSVEQASVLVNRLKTMMDEHNHMSITIGVVEYDGSESVDRFVNRAKQAMIAIAP